MSWSYYKLHASHSCALLFMVSCSACDTEKHKGLLAFEGNSVTADGSDGIVDIILRLQSRVDMHHLKVHRHAAEPAT